MDSQITIYPASYTVNDTIVYEVSTTEGEVLTVVDSYAEAKQAKEMFEFQV